MIIPPALLLRKEYFPRKRISLGNPETLWSSRQILTFSSNEVHSCVQISHSADTMGIFKNSKGQAFRKIFNVAISQHISVYMEQELV